MKKLLPSILFLLFFAPLYADDNLYQQIGPFGGLNNTDNSLIIGSGQASDLLNVDITPGGKSVKKRKGYAQAFQLTNSSMTGHGVHYFYDSGGSDVALYFNDSYAYASVSGASPTTLISTGPADATYQCVDSQGYAYCANTSRTFILKTNGTSTSYVTPISTGYIVAVTPTRLVMAGFSDYPNRIDFSQANDFTSWTPGGYSYSPVNFTVTAPGSKITHLVYAHERLYWFKQTSFGYIMDGPTLADWTMRAISSYIGTNDNTSLYRDGTLYFRGSDSEIYAFDGSSLVDLSREIGGTIGETQTMGVNSWTQTNQADWSASSITANSALDYTAVPGSVVLTTGSLTLSIMDSSTFTSFGSGTLTDVSTNVVPGSITLALGSTITAITTCDTVTGLPACGQGIYRSFTSTTGLVLTSISVHLTNNDTSNAQTVNFYIYSDNNTLPGSMLSYGGVSVPGAGNDFYTVGLYDHVPIVANSRYWIKYIEGDGCSMIDGVFWTGGSGTCNTSEYYSTNGISTTQPAYGIYRLNGKKFSTSGTLLSREFDTLQSTNTWLWEWPLFVTTGTIPSGGSITYETQTASYTGVAFNTLVSVSSGSRPVSPPLPIFKYKATFSNTDTSTSPVLSYVSLSTATKKRSFGSLYSQVHYAPNITAGDTFNTIHYNNDGTQTFYIRSSANNFSIASSTPAWVPIQSGQIPTTSTQVYTQFRDDFVITYATHNPTLESVTLNWFEGNAEDKSYATYHDDAIWWAVTSGTGATTNNKILRYDLINPYTWTIYDIPTNGMYIKNTSLYFVGSSTGVVYKFGDVDNDNGSAINAYWKSKDFIGISPFQDNEYTKLSLSAAMVANSSMTVTYTINGSSNTSYTMPLKLGNATFTKFNKNLPAGRVGTYFNFQFGNNAEDQPFEVFGAQYGYRPKPWAVTVP